MRQESVNDNPKIISLNYDLTVKNNFEIISYSDAKNCRNSIDKFINKTFSDIESEIYSQTKQRIYFSNNLDFYKKFDLYEVNDELISNAIDSILIRKEKEGHFKGLINVQIAVKDNLEFKISDNGVGIDKSLENTLFKKKINSKKTSKSLYSKSGGKGIGLYNVNLEIHSLNGIVGFKNNAPNGAEFYYMLPLNELKLN